MGMRARFASVSGNVSMKPGSTLFMRMSFAAYLSAKSFVKEASPARKTAEVGKAGSGSKAAKVEMFTIAPLSLLLHDGRHEPRRADDVQEIGLHAALPVRVGEIEDAPREDRGRRN